MRNVVIGCAALALLLFCVNASPARAAFGFKSLATTFTAQGGAAGAPAAGSHPESWSTDLAFNTTGAPGEESPDGALKDLRIVLPPGLVGTPGLLPRCSYAHFLAQSCPPTSEVGGIELSTSSAETAGEVFPVYNLEPLPGNAAELAFMAISVPITIELQIATTPPYNLIASIANSSQSAALFGSTLTIHGAPGAAPFLTLPRSCAPAPTTFEADPWGAPGAWVSSLAPEPLHPTGCGKLGFSPTLSSQPTTTAAAAPSGLDLSLSAPDEGISSPTGTAQADISRAVLSFPPRMTINPALATDLTACTPAELARETPTSAPGEGCPRAAKIGTAEVTTPLLDAAVAGTIFVAAPDDPATAKPGAENPFDTRFALYLALRDPERGVFLSLPIEIAADPATGRLTATLDQIPQLPLSRLELHFNPGPRAPLTTPASCGSHSISFTLSPSSGNPPLQGSDPFTIGSADCSPRFAPTLAAGTTSPAAGRSSPFALALSQASGEESLSQLSFTLPPGLSAGFAAVPLCPGALAAAGACPTASRLGFARIAAGPGPTPLWVPEAGGAPSAVYLAGPYRGAPFSLVVVVPVQAGPFDLGTVVTRAAISVDPVTAQARIRLDPLPRILGGVPIAYRTVRVVLDRAGFIRNPTSCAATAVNASVTSTAGTVAAATGRFQVGDCASLGFEPRASLRLLGPPHRSAHPRLRVALKARPGDAAIRRLALTLPRGELLENRHIQETCTRAQFKARSCPPTSLAGYAEAWSPLLDRPLAGPVYLRSSNGRLPGLGISLGGQVDLELSGRIEAARGRLRIAFEALPDTPLSKLVLTTRGGKQGLLVNSGGLCAGKVRASASFAAQNGKLHESNPVMRMSCGRPAGQDPAA